MAIRGNKRRRSIDRGFVISDHCDWDELLQSIEATGAEKVICTHGYTDLFAKYLSEQGYDARTEKTQFEETASEQLNCERTMQLRTNSATANEQRNREQTMQLQTIVS